MAGFPVVLSDNGSPFVPVSSGAPLATVSTNGFGVPIKTVSHNAPPLVIEGLVPPEVPSGFTLWAGSLSNGDIGYYTTIGGSISAEPMPGFPLVEFASRNPGYFQVALRGNVVSDMTGYEPVIEGVALGDFIMPWEYDEQYNETSATWESTGSMSVNQEYSITWSNAV